MQIGRKKAACAKMCKKPWRSWWIFVLFRDNKIKMFFFLICSWWLTSKCFSLIQTDFMESIHCSTEFNIGQKSMILTTCDHKIKNTTTCILYLFVSNSNKLQTPSFWANVLSYWSHTLNRMKHKNKTSLCKMNSFENGVSKMINVTK